MKYLILLSLLSISCSKIKPTVIYTAKSCNRDGCVILNKFDDYFTCKEFLKSIINLHKLKKDAPNKILGCERDI